MAAIVNVVKVDYFCVVVDAACSRRFIAVHIRDSRRTRASGDDVTRDSLRRDPDVDCTAGVRPNTYMAAIARVARISNCAKIARCLGYTEHLHQTI